METTKETLAVDRDEVLRIVRDMDRYLTTNLADLESELSVIGTYLDYAATNGDCGCKAVSIDLEDSDNDVRIAVAELKTKLKNLHFSAAMVPDEVEY